MRNSSWVTASHYFLLRLEIDKTYQGKCQNSPRQDFPILVYPRVLSGSPESSDSGAVVGAIASGTKPLGIQKATLPLGVCCWPFSPFLLSFKQKGLTPFAMSPDPDPSTFDCDLLGPQSLSAIDIGAEILLPRTILPLLIV
ncbi:hypothetical protein AMTR_s00076p00046310 [Amborella trichopoda]|uniref:Uncharacterized protein n=1 Tax=Amborella trichopoda TaxID=13333 RepID=W1PAM2_AMBTC|nr:hypothetical protein AMTR_s00076p00046310 [Amborella trichopoda]